MLTLNIRVYFQQHPSSSPVTLAPGSHEHMTGAPEVLYVLRFLSPVLAVFGLEGAHISTCPRACLRLSHLIEIPHLAANLLDSVCVQAHTSKGAL